MGRIKAGFVYTLVGKVNNIAEGGVMDEDEVLCEDCGVAMHMWAYGKDGGWCCPECGWSFTDSPQPSLTQTESNNHKDLS
jgi:ribosomal protein L37AE/L43A